MDTTRARELARQMLEPLGDRWAHTEEVVARARELALPLADSDRELLEVAAWCHDIGYAPQLLTTGFHAIDGASYLSARGEEPRLCSLVAHHSAAEFVAEQLGLSQELALWPRERSTVSDALWLADLTTGPQGQRFANHRDRIDEVVERYGPSSPVGKAMTRALPMIDSVAERVAELHGHRAGWGPPSWSAAASDTVTDRSMIATRARAS